MHSVQRHRSRLLTRVLSAAGLLLFIGAFFAAPLANALMLCTMPCCVQASTVAKIVPAAAGSCATECAISAPDATLPLASTILPSSPAPAITIDAVGVASGVAVASLVELQPDTSPHGVHAPIHVLNSTFRI